MCNNYLQRCPLILALSGEVSILVVCCRTLHLVIYFYVLCCLSYAWYFPKHLEYCLDIFCWAESHSMVLELVARMGQKPKICSVWFSPMLTEFICIGLAQNYQKIWKYLSYLGNITSLVYAFGRWDWCRMISDDIISKLNDPFIWSTQ